MFLLASLFGLSSSSHAEVGAGFDAELKLEHVILMGAIEDPGLWPSAWSPIRQSPAGFAPLNESGDSRDDGTPDLAIGSSGTTAHAVWALWNGTDYDIALAEWSGGDWSEPEFLTQSAVDDVEPRLNLLDGGGLGVVWWRDGATRSVFYSERGATGPFGPEIQISEPGDESLHPSVASTGAVTYVAFEEVGSAQRTVIVEKKTGAGPFVPEVIAITSRQACIDVAVHEAGGIVWVDWIDSDSHMGWSKLTETGWASPSFEPYTVSDIDRARLAIKGKALH
jgi:hypothetical protein